MKKIKNPIVPRAIPALVAASQHAIGGAAQFGAAIGLVHNNQAALEVDGNALVTTRDAYEDGKVALTSSRATLKSVTSTGRDFLVVARDTLKTRLGKHYSTAWNVAGFVTTLAVSRSPAKVQVMLQSMQHYLTTNPTAENEPLNVTAARAGGLFTNLNTAQITANVQASAISGLLKARDAARDQMVTRLRNLVQELGQLLDPMDDRWLAFGFKKPGAQVTPDVPQGLSAILTGPTAAALKWAAAPRAVYYRVWKKVVGTDERFVSVGSPADLDFTLEGLPSNGTVEIAISAVNDGGESAKSSTITLVMK